MIILTVTKNSGLCKNKTKNNNTSHHPTFILFDENNLSFSEVPYNETLNCKQSEEYFNINDKPSFRPFGITYDINNIYVASNNIICSFSKKNFSFKKKISETGLINSHQLCCKDGYLYRCDTAINCITKINLSSLEETYIDLVNGKVIPNLYECNSAYSKDLYHINSFCIYNNKLHIVASTYVDINDASKKSKYQEYMNISRNEINNYIDNYIDNDNSKTTYLRNKRLLNLAFIENNDDFKLSRHITYDIATNKIEKIDKIYSSKHHDILFINGNIWSLSTEMGLLIKKNSQGIVSEYKLVDAQDYYLRGITNDENFIYIFANYIYRKLNSDNNTNADSEKNKLCVFDIQNETIEYKLLPDNFNVVNQAVMMK